jgi:hypothetical protein
MNKIKIISLTVCVFLMGCAQVRQQDLDAWVGKPVGALDTHSVFLTIPMVKTVTPEGIEIRNYVNKVGVSSCAASGFGTSNANGTGTVMGNTLNAQTMSYSNFNAFQNCSSRMVGCDNIFYIKNKKVIEYKPVGSCYTNETAQPEATYLRLMQ